MKYILVYALLISSCISCNSNSTDTKNSTSALIRPAVKRLHITALEQSCKNLGLINLADIDTLMKIKIVYATDSNFMGFSMYGDFDKAYLQPDVARKLINANRYLMSINPKYRIIVYDAARPQSVQQMMWDSLKIPLWQRSNFVANPSTGSLHNYGCAVDVSIIDENGTALDMGTHYDSPELLAYPSLESKFFSEQKLSSLQLENRILLRKIMKYAGFSPIESEWWHFNATSLAAAKSKYKIIP